ncbi:MAG: glycerol-3-phosphate 1-O-acyltransferase PlsY [Deltaproteobacteria bacterium]|nr:MAG: glycerol-3-phosphate 1-O-acyltransferase PlsY [Deltaproteobacteria bacterium]
MDWLDTVLLVLVAYLFGSVPSGYWIARLVAGIDVRTVGSKNIGATNVTRTLGLKWGLLVLLLDMAKGAAPVAIALNLWSNEAETYPLRVAVVAFAAFFGHLRSLFLGFHGGKGVATALGISLVLLPRASLPALVVFLCVTWLCRYVSVGSIAAVFSLPIWTLIAAYDPVYVGLTSVLAFYVLMRHRDNVRALLQGRERRL